MKNLQYYLIVLFALYVNGTIQAQSVPADSIPSKEEKNRNVMLNATDASKPREVSIGLPSSVGGTDIFEDGLPVVYYFWPHMPHRSWRGGVAYEKVGLTKLSETAITSGNVGYSINSLSRLGGAETAGFLNYTANHFGLQRIDMNLSGAITPEWTYSGSVFQNFDPGNIHLPFMELTDRTQVYKAALTRLFANGRGKLSFLYKYAHSNILTDGTGPFYYQQDGSVKPSGDFRMGRDSYLPADGRLDYMDVRTGKIVSSNIRDLNLNKSNDAGILLDYHFNDYTRLNMSFKYSHANSDYTNLSLSGIDAVEEAGGYTLSDGTPFAGDVQNRYILLYRGHIKDYLFTSELTRRNGNSEFRFGLNQWYDNVELATSSVNMAHEVTANPKRLAYNGNEFWGFNTGAEYYKGKENKLALYYTHEWIPSSAFNLYYGLRLEYYHISGNALLNPTGEDRYNNRTENFSMAKEGVRLTPFNHNWINPIATVSANYKLTRHFGLNAEYLFNRQRPRLENFGGQDFPSLDPVDVHLGRAGIYFQNKWLNVVSALSYIRKTNFMSRVQFTRPINGVSETQTRAIMYDIATLGWTTDAVVSPFKGFNLHLLATWQKPEYKNFITHLQFSDGTEQTYDFSNRIVTGVSELLFEIDPSYEINDWRFWLSFRYFSKQYINKPNTLFFKGRWENFGGVSYKVNKYLALNLNVINFLNQTGAQGNITAADLVEDASLYDNYLMSGTAIRPFTVEFGVNVSF